MNLAGLTHASLFQRLGLLIAFAPLIAGFLYALRPSERRLMFMRPLSLASTFSAIASLLLGVANAVHYMGTADAGTTTSIRPLVALAEAIIPSFIAFTFLAAAWVCVAVGMRTHE
jgi:hypothetical protein